jgi:hypothetical protein
MAKIMIRTTASTAIQTSLLFAILAMVDTAFVLICVELISASVALTGC